MPWFENLKEFVKVNLDFNISNLVNIQINSNNISERVEYNEAEELLSINLTKLEPDDFERFGEISKEAVNEGATLLEKKSQERIVDIKSKEELKDVQELLKYFKGKIPPDDFAVLRQAIYIKKLFEEGGNFEVIYRLKGEVIRKYGKRGLNICNLYSSGYFDTTIKPLYEEIKKQKFDENVFLENYDIIINEEAFAVFVSGNMLLHNVRDIVRKKMKRNIKYGIRTVTIHGIGQSNVSKISDVISELEEENLINKKEMYVKGNIIFAKLLL